MTKGPFERNLRQAIDAAHILLENNIAPFVPHLNFVIEMVYPKDYEVWMAMDFAIIERCDALLRLPGESKGADREVIFAQNRDIPVFTSITELVEWARSNDKEKLSKLAPGIS